jgi:hypothetical protein
VLQLHGRDGVTCIAVAHRPHKAAHRAHARIARPQGGDFDPQVEVLGLDDHARSRRVRGQGAVRAEDMPTIVAAAPAPIPPRLHAPPARGSIAAPGRCSVALLESTRMATETIHTLEYMLYPRRAMSTASSLSTRALCRTCTR